MFGLSLLNGPAKVNRYSPYQVFNHCGNVPTTCTAGLVKLASSNTSDRAAWETPLKDEVAGVVALFRKGDRTVR